jgi:hypothetical protein
MSLPPSYNLLAKYPNKWFIESGTFRSDAIALALDAGFEHIRTIDIDPEAAIFCSNRFWLTKNTHLDIKCYTGDSAVMLWEMIRDIDEPITFWLDSHSQLFEDEKDFGAAIFPLLKELEQIYRHPVKTHTILIDDILMMTHPDVTGWTRERLEIWLTEINPSYKFEYIANPVKNNLLVCSL